MAPHSGDIRINEDRITDVIKVIWGMQSIGLFTDQNGNKPTMKRVMEVFAEALGNETMKQYYVYLNKALKTTQPTFLDIFNQLQDYAKKYYKDKVNGEKKK